MKYGEAKWVIHPLGVKVRLMQPDDWEEVWETCNDFPIDETDYAGVEHLKQRLYDLNLIDGTERELGFFEIEPLDPDWKSKHLDHCRDEYGQPSIYEEWFCEIDPWESADNKDVYCKKKMDEYVIERNPNAKLVNDRGFEQWENVNKHPSGYLQKEWVNEFCKLKGLGRIIPLFLAQYQADVEWIEEHIKTQEIEEVRKPDGRGKNPNSLANLRQFKKEVVQ